MDTKPRTRNDDPAIRNAQGRKGAGLRLGRPEVVAEAELDLREAILAKRIRELADAMPPLSDERRARLAGLLVGGAR